MNISKTKIDCPVMPFNPADDLDCGATGDAARALISLSKSFGYLAERRLSLLKENLEIDMQSKQNIATNLHSID